MTQTVFVYSRCSACRNAPAAGATRGFSGGSAVTGHALQGSHTAQWDLLAESRANAVLHSHSLKLRAASWAPWRSWGTWTASGSIQVRHRWLWNRAGQHCHQNIEVDRLQGPHSAFKEVFICAAQLLESFCNWCPLAKKWDKHLPRSCPLSTQTMRFLPIASLCLTRRF